MIFRTLMTSRSRTKTARRVSRRISLDWQRLELEPLEDRCLLAIDFIAGPLAVPLTDRTDVALGLLGGFDPIEPMVAINQTDPGNVAVTSHIGLRLTDDVGVNFDATDTFPTAAGQTGSSGDTDQVYDAQGRLFWSNLGVFGGQRDVIVSQIDPTNGNQIGVTSRVPNGGFGDDKPFLAADSNPDSPFANNLYVTWSRFGQNEAGEFDVYFSRSTDQAVTWSVPLLMSDFDGPNNVNGDADDEGFNWPSDVAAAPNGDVYAAYHSQPDINDGEVEGAPAGAANPNGTSGQIFVLRSTDGGVTFPQKTLAFQPGQADVTYNRQSAAGTIPGTDFWMLGAPQPWVLADPVRPGNIYVISNDDPNNAPGNGDDGNVVISRSVDNGLNWTVSTIEAGPANSFQLFPFASIDEFGNIVVAWYDNRAGATNAGGNFLLDVFATYSTDGGVTWAPEFQINDVALDPDIGAVNRFPGDPVATTRIGEYFGIDLFGGTAHVAFNGPLPLAGAQTDQQVVYDAFAINGQIVVTGDDNGAPTDDQFLIRRLVDDPDFIEIFVNGQRQYAGLLEGITQIDVQGLGGNDQLSVDSSNGLLIIPNGIRFDGGAGFDRLDLDQVGGPTITTDTLSVGATAGAGVSTIVGPTGTQRVDFANLEPVVDNVPSPTLIINGGLVGSLLNAANAINYQTSDLFGATWGEVTIDNFEPIHFTNKTNLTINAEAGSDEINLNNPNTPTALTSINIIGGDPTASDTLIVNGIAGVLDNLRYLPTSVGAGTVINDNAPQPNVLFTGIEHLTEVVQQADGDGVRVDGTLGNDAVEFFHGLTSDSGSFVGTMDQNNATGVGPFTMTPMSYSGISPLANDTDVNFFGAGGTDTFVFNGTANDDNIVIATGEAGGTLFRNTLNGILVVNLEVFNITSGLVRGLEGNDTITLNLPAGPAAVALRIEGGDSDQLTDVLNYNAPAGSATTIDYGTSTITSVAPAGNPVSFSGIERINEASSGAGSTLTINGTAGNDHLTYTPTGATAGTVTLAGASPIINFTGVGSTFTLNAAAGVDVVTVNGRSDNDNIIIVRGATTTNVSVVGLKTVSLPTANTEALQVFGNLGDDQLNVNVGAAVGSDVIPIPIYIDGGLGADLLDVFGAPPTAVDEVIATVGPGVGQGRLRYEDAANTRLMTIDYTNLEPVIDVVPATTLTVIATDADNAISYTAVQILGAGGRVAVDNFEAVEFSNKTNLVINALGGSDTISLNNPTTPPGLTSITVNGGDPTAGSDTVVVNGTAAPNTITVDLLTEDGARVTGAQPVPIVVAGTELLVVNGLNGSDDLTYITPAGDHFVEYTPGGISAPDSGSLRTLDNNNRTLLAVDHQDLGDGGSLTFADVGGGRADALFINGTANGDSFNVQSTGTVQVQAPPVLFFVSLSLATPGIGELELRGLDGNDIFNILGNHPFPGIFGSGINVQGGNPGSGSDVLNFTAAAAPPAAGVTVNLETSTVVQAGSGAVFFSGVETLNVAANGQALAVTGTDDDEDLTVTVLTATSGIIERGYAVQQNGQVDPAIVAPLINYSGLATAPGNALAIDLALGEDTLVVVGNAFAQNWDVNAAAGTVAIDDVPNGAGNDGLVTFVGTESLAVFGLEGNDAFTVTSGPIPVFVDGGDPIGNNLPGDSIIVIGAIVFFPGPEVDEGGFLTLGGTISFDHIESIIVVPGPCPPLILGTNGDDDITVIARTQQIVNGTVFYPGADGVQDFTVSVNGGIEILFLNQPDLFIDALAGDDDIVIRTPAPNDASWDVNVRVAGGPPSIGEPNEGDRLVLETPGFDNIIFNPTGPDTGNIVIDEDGDGVYTQDPTPPFTDSIITFGPFVYECDDPMGGPVEFTYISSPGGVELVEYDGEDDEADPVGGVVDNANDIITINGTVGDDTTTVSPQDLGSGTFVSSLSPLFVFRSFQSLTVNPGTPATGFDQVIYNATAGADTITSDADTLFLADGLIHDVTIGAGIDRLEVNTFAGDDNVDLDLTDPALQKVINAGAGNDSVNLSGSIDADIFGGDGNDLLVGSPDRDFIDGGRGDDALFGLAQADRLEGGEGNDVMVGGTADDFAFGGAGSDTFNWNPGDGDDLFEGDDGDDTLAFAGANGTDTYVIFGENGRVIFQRQPGNVGINMGGVENIIANSETIEMSGRKEVPANTSPGSGFANFFYNPAAGTFDIRMFVTGLNSAIIDSHIHMNIPGSNGPVVVPFGPGFVPVAGGFELTAAGLSLASIVPPAGFTAQDVLMEILLGRAYFNVHTAAPAGFPGGEVRGNIIIAGTTAGSGGGDSLEVRDTTGTSLRTVAFDAGNEAEILNGAALVDTVTVQGLNTPDVIVAGVPNVLDNNYLVTGLPYNILVTSSDGLLANGALRDQFVLNGNGGDDNLKALPPVEDVTRVTLDGGQGDDFLSADAILIGGPGDDFLEGGAGDDQLFGNAGEDTMIGHGGVDTYDGGADFDTILVLGTSGNDTIQAIQTAANTLVHTVQDQLGTLLDGGTQTDTFINTERVRIEARDGDDTLRVSIADALNAIANASLLFDIDGGQAFTRDRLAVIDDGVDDLTIYRKGESDETGSFTIGPGNADPFDFVFAGVEFSEVLDELNRPISIVLGNGRLVVFKHDPFEANNDIAVATHLGASQTINVDPTIDPGPVTAGPPFNFTLPGDQDWYRVEALHTGTLDFQVFFEEIGILASGRPGLPANGNLDIQVYDVDGTLIAGAGPLFGINDGPGELNVDFDAFAENERIRIPAVQGQVYYLRVFGAPPIGGAPSAAINNYNVTVINEPAPVPFDLELHDFVFPGTVTAGVSLTQFNGNAALPAVDDFFNGKVVSFNFDTTTTALRLREATVLDYIGATRTFILSPFTPLPAVPAAGDTFQVESIDTGRNSTDNTTRDNTPTIIFRLDDAFFLNDIPGNDVSDTPPDEVIPIPFIPGPLAVAPGYRIAIFDEGTTPGGPTVTPPQTPLGFATFAGDLNNNGLFEPALGETFQPGVYQFTTPILADGSHFLTARVQMIDPSNTDGAPTVPGIQPMTGFGERSLSLEIVVDTVQPPVSFGDPADPNDGLLADSDSGVSPPNPDTLIDLISNDVTPTFWGRAEANTIVRLYVDNLNTVLFPLTTPGVFDQFDVFIGQDTAIPIDGNLQEPNGYWEINSVVNFNDPTFFPTLDGVRTVFVTAEDVAGNVRPAPGQIELELDIFIDTQGPQVTSVFITDVPAYDLFNPKGPDANAQGPTPLVKQLTITFTDPPIRIPPFLHPALKADTVITDHFQLIGDQNGRIAIVHPLGLVQTLVPVPGMPGFFFATATVTLTFFTPLPDDRFTLIITDDVRDPVGNRLDGESNAAEPQENPRFPSGDGIPGGDFVARFTVDSRPELALYAGIRVYADINGNFLFDPEGQDNDHVNRDIVFRFGSTSDALFAGKFVTPANVAAGAGVQVPAPVVANRFFDQFAAYGNILGVFRWLFDFDSNGVADLVTTQPAGFQINGIPVAGNFDGNFANGDEIGLFDGVKWWRDTNHDFVINGLDAPPINGLSAGFPQVGDVDGDALEDFITYQGDTYFVDFANNGLGVGPVTSIPLTLDGGGLGFPGVSERPTVADMNQDGIDDFGIWVPGNLGQTPTEISEWFFLVSEYPLDPNDPLVTHVPGQPVPGVQPGTLWSFQVFPLVNGSPRRHFEPVPFGTSLFAVFGDEPAFPIVGNFDPPVDVGSGSGSPGGLDTNNVLVTSTGPGAEPRVHVFNRQTGDVVLDILAYDPAFRGGVQVATADVNGDGVVDIITAPGPGGGPHIRVFDGTNGAVIREFFAYNAAFAGGVLVAAGDFDGDGQAEIVTGPGAGGGPHVRIFSGADNAVLGEYFAYNAAFTGGVNVAVGDVDGDGTLDVITGAGAGGGPHVRVFSGVTNDEILGFFAYNPAFGGGVYVAAGDVDGDGRDDVITGAGAGGGPHVRVFSGEDGAELGGFFAYDAAFGGGVRVASGDFDGDGRADILTGPGAGGGPHVKAFDGDTLDHVATFMAFDEGFTGGVFVAAPNLGGGQPLHAANAGSGGAALTQSQLDQLVAAVFDTSRVRVRVANLPGTILGLAYPDLVLIDSDAAGHGWFVDSTPGTSDDLDVDSMDLLTAVAHELGHVLGLEHGDDPLMDGQLSVGVRRALAVSVVDQIFADL